MWWWVWCHTVELWICPFNMKFGWSFKTSLSGKSRSRGKEMKRCRFCERQRVKTWGCRNLEHRFVSHGVQRKFLPFCFWVWCLHCESVVYLILVTWFVSLTMTVSFVDDIVSLVPVRLGLVVPDVVIQVRRRSSTHSWNVSLCGVSHPSTHKPLVREETETSHTLGGSIKYT